MNELPPHVPMTFHKGLVTDGNGKENPHEAYLTYGSAHSENPEDADIEIHGGGAHKAAQAIAEIPNMLMCLQILVAMSAELTGADLDHFREAIAGAELTIEKATKNQP